MADTKMNVREVVIDINKPVKEYICAKQNDVQSRYLLFKITDRLVAFNLTGKTVRAYGVKPDGKEIYNDLVIIDALTGACELELTTQVLAFPGDVKFELEVMEGVKKLSTIPFKLDVIPSLNNGNSIESTNEFTALVNGLNSLNEYDSYKNEIKTARGSEVNLGAKIGKIDSSLAEKANKSDVRINTMLQPIVMAELSTEVKSAMTGGSVAVVGENAVGLENIKQNAVTIDKCNIISSSSYTISDFCDIGLNALGQIISSTPAEPLKTKYIEITKHFKGRLTVNGTHNRLRVCMSSSKNIGHMCEKIIISNYVPNGKFEIDISNEEGYGYLIVYVSNAGEMPDIDVIPKSEVSTSEDVNRVLDLKTGTNLYTGDMVKGTIFTDNSNWMFKNDENANGIKVCIIKIEQNKTYTVAPVPNANWNRNRIGLFINYPQNNTTCTEIYVYNEMKNITFNNTSCNYAVIYLSNDEKNIIECQMNEGSTALPYEPYSIKIKGINISSSQISTQNDSSIIEKYSIIENVKADYMPLIQPSMAFGQPTVLRDTKHTFIYSIYDNLANQFPNYITKTLLGTDSIGNNIYQYKFIPEKPSNDVSSKRIKLILTTCTHGNEKGGAYNVAKFMEEICTRHSEVDMLDFLRYNVEFIIIPVVSPSGYDNNSRVTANGVNINRNFENNWIASADMDYGGTAPYSEKESQFVKKVIDENLDADFLIDYHNFGMSNSSILWFPLVNQEPKLKNICGNFISLMTRKWRKKYEWIPKDKFAGLVDTFDKATVISYSTSRGIPSATFEISQIHFDDPNKQEFDSNVLTMGLEAYGNYVLSIIKTL